jgi:hypothetical protein
MAKRAVTTMAGAVGIREMLETPEIGVIAVDATVRGVVAGRKVGLRHDECAWRGRQAVVGGGCGGRIRAE